MENSLKQLKGWIRSQHLICEGTDFVFETVDQTQLEKFENIYFTNYMLISDKSH